MFVRLPNKHFQDHISGDHCIRWTELFILPTSRLNTSHSEQQQADFADPPGNLKSNPSLMRNKVSSKVYLSLVPNSLLMIHDVVV